jgi:uncharacterized protein
LAVDRNQNRVFGDRVDFPFWDGLARGRIQIQRCNQCARWIWPAEWRCGQCGSFELHWEETPGTGTVYAWERTHYPFMPSFADLIPYVTVLVELPQAGNRRLFGLLVGSEDGLRIGAPVEAAIQPASERTKSLSALWWRLASNKNP